MVTCKYQGLTIITTTYRRGDFFCYLLQNRFLLPEIEQSKTFEDIQYFCFKVRYMANIWKKKKITLLPICPLGIFPLSVWSRFLFAGNQAWAFFTMSTGFFRKVLHSSILPSLEPDKKSSLLMKQQQSREDAWARNTKRDSSGTYITKHGR